MNVLLDGELILHGNVGEGIFFDGFSSNDVIEALAQIGRHADVVVRINSGGGVATEGAAIYAALRSHRGQVLCLVEGVAASAASLIAMAGDRVAMQKGSVMMVHDPSGFTAGTAKDHKKSEEALDAIAQAMAEIYAEKTGKSVEDARQDMLEETWMTAEEAVAAGYADEMDADLPDLPPTAFNYRLYQHAPEAFVAMADANGWTKKDYRKPAPRAERQHQETEPMTTVPAKPGTAATAETVEQMTARIRGEENKRLTDITAACTQAGKPEKALEYFTAGKSLSDVVAALETDRLAAANATKPNGGTAANPAPATETVAQIEARLRTEMSARISDITSACALAGKPEKAAAFIADSTKTVRDVMAALQSERVTEAGKGKKQPATAGAKDEVTARHGVDNLPAEGAEEATAAWGAIIDKRHPKATAARR